ncbi:hypothetical protein E1301_Tti023627 [Triplophysa tibetana]|uniref:C2H2-type domain-containing protein n=1 Tax=Triplophysa tibetana TaxID=1572043 RepID=A0A5A9PIC1_9TELE|nr:hypothetical protein E1301_Tti023627 [Triplophysa tibetana]
MAPATSSVLTLLSSVARCTKSLRFLRFCLQFKYSQTRFFKCKCKFSKYNALKAHVYRHHKIPHTHFDDSTGMFVCNNTDCQQQFTDMNNVLSHLRSHLSKRELVCCPFEKCDKKFSLRSSFTAHVSRKHRTSTFAQLRIMDTLSEQPSSAFFDVTEDEVDEREFTDSLTKCNAKSLYMKNLCLFYMQLQAKYLVPSSTIQMIVEEFSGLNYISHQYTQKMFREILKSKTAHSQFDIESVVQTLQGQDLHSACNSLLSTEYQRRQYYQNFFSYVHPQIMYLGRDENRNQRYAQYIPLKNTCFSIEKTMLIDSVLKSVDLGTYSPHLYSDAVCKAVETSLLNEPDFVSTRVEYKEMDALLTFIENVFPNPITSKLAIEGLNSLGVETIDDLQFLKDDNLGGFLIPIEARKLIAQIPNIASTLQNTANDLSAEYTSDASGSPAQFDHPALQVEDKYQQRNENGCINSDPQLLDGETSELQQEKKEKLLVMFQNNEIDVKTIYGLMTSTYTSQRNNIQSGKETKDLLDEWPYLFQPAGMKAHFKELTGIDINNSFE